MVSISYFKVLEAINKDLCVCRTKAQDIRNDSPLVQTLNLLDNPCSIQFRQQELYCVVQNRWDVRVSCMGAPVKLFATAQQLLLICNYIDEGRGGRLRAVGHNN